MTASIDGEKGGDELTSAIPAVMRGGSGDDRMFATSPVSDDSLFGGAGLDTFLAGAGDDIVRSSDDPAPGNLLAEEVRCGTGRDRAFVNRSDIASSCEILTIAP